MKLVILAGGLGTRLSEETVQKPKPMVEIGGFPILWHIMKIYSQHGIRDFVICCGYKGYLIKEYFANLKKHTQDFTIDTGKDEITFHSEIKDEWKVTLIDTGENTQTGGRLKRVSGHVDDRFLMTYGDGVGNVDITRSIKDHLNSNQLVSMTAVQPPGRFGALDITNDIISGFMEKPKGDGAWINAGFFVLEKAALDLIEDDGTVWEQEPLESLAKQRQLRAHFHDGFWRPMDTLRDKIVLDEMWNSGQAPWKIW